MRSHQELIRGTSLVFQWLRICLPILGTHLRSLVGKLRFPHVSGQLVSPRAPALWSPSTPQLEKPAHHKERFRMLQLRPDRAKKKKKQKKNTPQGKIPHATTKARQSQKKKIVDQSVTQSLRGSQVARLGQRCCLLLW